MLNLLPVDCPELGLELPELLASSLSMMLDISLLSSISTYLGDFIVN